MTPVELDEYIAARLRAFAQGLDPMCTCGHPRSWHLDGPFFVACRSVDADDTCVKFELAT